MKFADQTGITELITLTKKALKPLETFKKSVTDVNGIVKSDGKGGFSAAAAGTDYAAASHTHDYLPLSGGTLTGDLTVGSASVKKNGYIEGTWLKTTSATSKAGNFATIDGDGWVYYRTPAETLADIGAASASHTHTTSQVEGLSTAIEEAKPFIINVTGWTFGTGDLIEDAVADKTYSEAYTAYLAGKKVVMRVNGRELSMLEASNSNMTFSLALPDAPDTLNSVDMASAVWSSNGSLECGDGLIQIPLLPSTAGLLKVTANKQIHLAVAGTDYAAASHNHSASNITSGTIPIARGGTGATSASSALSNLGAVPKSGGTMTGPLVAQTNTSYTTAQMRNIIISTADPSGGNNGDIWLKYEA